MYEPLTLCIRYLAALQSKLNSEMPDILPWQIVEENTDLDAKLHLYLGIQGPPSFCNISFYCHTPIDAFHERFLEFQTTSGIGLSDIEIPNFETISSIIKDEYTRRFSIEKEGSVERGLSNKDYAPLIIIQRLHRHSIMENHVLSQENVEVKYSPIHIHLDLSIDEDDLDLEEITIVNALFGDVVSLRRVLDKLK